MGRIGNIAKTAAAIKAKEKAKDKAITIGERTVKKKAGDWFTPFAPIALALWIFHPKKALYFFMLQKSAGFAWRIAKAILYKKV